MKLVLAVPVRLRSITRIAQIVFAAAASLVCMYLLFGIVGCLVLVAELCWLGWLLLKTAHGE